MRAEGTNLTIALYQYIGPGIEPWLADLKPVQVKELKDSFEALEKDGKGHRTLKPERLTRVQARETASNEEAEVAEEEEEGSYLVFPLAIFIDRVRICNRFGPS